MRAPCRTNAAEVSALRHFCVMLHRTVLSAWRTEKSQTTEQRAKAGHRSLHLPCHFSGRTGKTQHQHHPPAETRQQAPFPMPGSTAGSVPSLPDLSQGTTSFLGSTKADPWIMEPWYQLGSTFCSLPAQQLAHGLAPLSMGTMGCCLHGPSLLLGCLVTSELPVLTSSCFCPRLTLYLHLQVVFHKGLKARLSPCTSMASTQISVKFLSNRKSSTQLLCKEYVLPGAIHYFLRPKEIQQQSPQGYFGYRFQSFCTCPPALFWLDNITSPPPIFF